MATNLGFFHNIRNAGQQKKSLCAITHRTKPKYLTTVWQI